LRKCLLLRKSILVRKRWVGSFDFVFLIVGGERLVGDLIDLMWKCI
jgi:hypothetical protein